MPEEVLFESESTQSRQEIAAYLRTVADNLADSKPVTLSSGSDSLSLEVPSRPTFEVKAERETDSSGRNPELSLELEIEWDETGESTDESGSLSIE